MAWWRRLSSCLFMIIWISELSSAQQQKPDLGLSECATECVLGSIQISGCQPTDPACVCISAPYEQAVGSCLQANCTVRESLAAQRYQKTTCKAPIRDAGARTMRITWGLYGLAVASVLGRFVFRNAALNGSGYGLDDWTILLGLLLLTPLCAMLDDMTRRGLGRDIWMVNPDNVTEILYFFWAGEQLYIFILVVTKCSILLLYLRIWTVPENGRSWFRTSCFILIGLLIGYGGSFSLSLGLQCQPISYSWERWDNENVGNCMDLEAWVYALGGANIGLDILVYFLPVLMLMKLTMSWRKKIGVASLFLVGLFVTICSVIRLRYLAVWGNAVNLTWNYNDVAMWSLVETNLSVVCACLPAMAGLLQRLWRVTFGSGNFSYGTGGTSTRHNDFDEVQLARLCTSPTAMGTPGGNSGIASYEVSTKV